MVLKIFMAMIFLLLAIPPWSHGYGEDNSVVDVRVLSDRDGEFAQFRACPGHRCDGRYFYLEAVKGERYSIEVTNKSARRIGVVIAVDGRNIVSGGKSNLRSSEGMYIIGPYATNVFEGWRTGMERTNRFYFTNQSDSYAEKVFSDASAMGTIALAAYREKLPPIMHKSGRPFGVQEAPAGTASPAPAEKRSYSRAEREKSEEAGTGFGETIYSPTRQVRFEPEGTLAEKIVLKYEWRQELCLRGISCNPRNRFWPDNGGFAPLPRDFKG